MVVTVESGRRLSIPTNHPVFAPVQRLAAGQRVDASTVPVARGRAAALRRGDHIIVDGRVERVAAVAAA